jgi:nucleoside-diphosphate-sugar epimerase
MKFNRTLSGTIALTGATGFIGSALLRRLETAGWQIRALVRPASIHKRGFETAAEWIEGDLEDLPSLRRLVQGAEVVLHCAGTVRGATQAQFNRINVDGVARLVQVAMEQRPAPRFLLMSSLAAREPNLSPYAASKSQGEKMLIENAAEMPWVAFRPPAVYGPGDRELFPILRWMFRGIAPMMGSGNGRFSLIFIEDLADAVVQWLDCAKRQRCTFELHDGHPAGYSWNDVVDTVARLRGGAVVRIMVPAVLVRWLAGLNLISAHALGYAPMLTPGKIRELAYPNWICDNAALSNATGWIPRIKLADGLRRTFHELSRPERGRLTF